jgi:hypothetical protein
MKKIGKLLKKIFLKEMKRKEITLLIIASCPGIHHPNANANILTQLPNLPRAAYYLYAIKHLEKICNVCGGHFTSMNFPPRNWEEYYAYSSRVGRKLCLPKVSSHL